MRHIIKTLQATENLQRLGLYYSAQQGTKICNRG